MTQLLDPNWNRAALLPYARHKQTGEGAWAVPQVAVDLLKALMLPGDVYQGNVLLRDPQTGQINDEVIKRSADLAGGMTLGAGAVPAQANSLRMGIKAYHGSPHDFDRFSMDKIGTGEGAQAYGHGLYFAENEGVAKAYRDALSGRNGDQLTPEGAAERFMGQYGDGQKAIAALDDTIATMRKQAAALERRGIDTTAFLARIDNEYAPAKELIASGYKTGGRMYEVNIDANPDDFLDWDKPIEAQPSKVRELLEPLARRAFEQENTTGLPKTGEELLSGAKSVDWPKLADDRGAIERQLRDAGIPGIRYRDAGSRDKDGDGSRNYVVFDDKLISIVKKYGIAAAVASGVITQQQAAQMQAQGDI